ERVDGVSSPRRPAASASGRFDDLPLALAAGRGNAMTSLQSLGDQAALAHFAEETDALLFAAAVLRRGPACLVDVVQAYVSVAVFFDADQIGYAAVADSLPELASARTAETAVAHGQLHRIPCCYELNLDLQRVAEHTGLSADEVIRLH